MNSLKAYLIFFVTGEEDQSFSFHEESSAAGNFASENMGNISAQPSIFDAPSEHIPRMSPGLNKVSPGVKTVSVCIEFSTFLKKNSVSFCITIICSKCKKTLLN